MRSIRKGNAVRGGRKPPTPEGWVYDNPFDDVVIEGDGVPTDSIWGGIVGVAHKFGGDLMESASIWNPLTYPQWLIGATMEGLTDAPNKYLQGEDVDLGDTLLFGIEAIPGIGLAAKGAKHGVKAAIGHTAKAQDITKRDHAYQQIGDEAAWYSGLGGKVKQLSGMPGIAAKAFTDRLVSPEAYKLYNKHGITRAQMDEFIRAFDYEKWLRNPNRNLDDYPNQWKKGPTGRISFKGDQANPNEILSQGQYMLGVAQKYFPDKPQFQDELAKLLFPSSVKTTGDIMAESALPMRKLFGDFGYLDNMTDAEVLTHISRPIVGRPGGGASGSLAGKEVVLNTRPFGGNSPLSDLRSETKTGRGPATWEGKTPIKIEHGTEGQYNAAATAAELVGKLPDGPVTVNDLLAVMSRNNDELFATLAKIDKEVMDGIKRNKDGSLPKNWRKLFRSRSLKKRADAYRDNPKMDINSLYDGMEETDGFLSFDGRILAQDRLFANLNQRVIIDKKTGDAYLMSYDELRQGTGSGTIDKVLNAGTAEGIGLDIAQIRRTPKGTLAGDTPLSQQQVMAEGAGYSPQPRKFQQQLAQEIEAQLRPTFDDAANLSAGDYAKWGASTGAKVGLPIATGVGIWNEATDED